MSVEKEREVGPHLAKEGCHIVVVIVDTVVHHAVTSSQAITSQIYQMDVKTVQSVLDCTLQVDIRTFGETMHNGNRGSDKI